MRVTILGLGNVLVGDDALGPWVVRTLEADYELAPEIAVIDGTPGNDLIPHLLGVDALVVVDTVAAAGEPGELRLYRREQILATPLAPRINPHEPGLKESLLTLDLVGGAARGPAGRRRPRGVRTGIGLTAAVHAAVPAAVAAVVAELPASASRRRCAMPSRCRRCGGRPAAEPPDVAEERL